VAIAAVVLIVGAGYAYVTISAPVITTSVSSVQTSGSSASASSGASSGSGSSSSSGATTSGSGGSSAATVTLPSGVGGNQQLNFSPPTLSVAAGTTITFQDQDSSATHNVDFQTGPSGATLPSVSPNLKEGSTFQVTLTTPGTYTYVCDYHAWMKGTITVT
jgi:plastocyanin